MKTYEGKLINQKADFKAVCVGKCQKLCGKAARASIVSFLACVCEKPTTKMWQSMRMSLKPIKYFESLLSMQQGPSQTVTFLVFCFDVVLFFVGFDGPGGGFGGFLFSSRCSGFATTFTTNGKATKTTTRTNTNLQNKTKNETKQNEKHRLAPPLVLLNLLIIVKDLARSLCELQTLGIEDLVEVMRML